MIKLIRPALALFLPVMLVSALHAGAPAIAASAAEARPLTVGTKAPALTLSTADGTEVALGSAFAEKPTILVFYRGSWCPFCNRQLAALGELEPRLIALGYQILAVSPDTAAGLQAMAGKNHLNYRLLSDHEMNASAAYGVAFHLSPETEQTYHKYGVELTPIPGGEGFWLPVPAVFIVGRDGLIKYVYSNPDYKVRLAAIDLFAAAEAAAK